MVQEIVGQQESSEQKPHEADGSNLLSLASHELRTPLSVIKWYTEMLLDGDCGELNADQTKYLRTIQTSNQRAIDLIKSLLNVSRLDLGTFSINPTDVDLRFIVKQVFTENRSILDEKRIHTEEMYVSGVPGMIPILQLDKQICLVIIRNLISNAVIYSKEDSAIRVDIREKKQGEEYGSKILSDDSLVLAVFDSGIGIPQEEQGKVFSKLFKASNVTNEESKGAGLGLYIVETILSKIGGSIWFTSVKGQGSTFCVAFPKHGMPKKEGRTMLE
ncbi:HAMP domain-containing histidine kinase [Candidatus Gracilibacteria bacterium]|nr:HAMP domain-containing histidine kinase [Candidatus Gracilibacteria bacterium]